MTMIKTVWRDKDGKVINIGEWDYQIQSDGEGMMVFMNPAPLGATSKEEEVVYGWDGGLYVKDDPRQHGVGTRVTD